MIGQPPARNLRTTTSARATRARTRRITIGAILARSWLARRAPIEPHDTAGQVMGSSPRPPSGRSLGGLNHHLGLAQRHQFLAAFQRSLCASGGLADERVQPGQEPAVLAT